MVSIILPFYNAEKYLAQSIQSVLDQNYLNWELLLINDGSIDGSKEIALQFKDFRIRYFEQENKGVSSARNVGLNKMKGIYFCFLDADDILPQNSILSRYHLLENDHSLSFADGIVQKYDKQMKTLIDSWTPNFYGSPLNDLIKLTGFSFFSPTWMIRNEKNKPYQFHEGLTHGEDLLFFMELARTGGKYAFTQEVVLKYRKTPDSAMSNLSGLEMGYRFIESQILRWPEVNKSDFRVFRWKYRKSMTISYLRKMYIIDAIRVWFK